MIQELTPLEGPGFEHSVFDVCGHSPLVKFFLKNKHLQHKKEHSTLVKRTEISELPPAQAICYKDILDQSKDFEKKNQAAFRRLEIRNITCCMQGQGYLTTAIKYAA